LTQKHLDATGLLACWKPGEDEPWLLATNLPDVTTTLRACRYRMWIEEMFGDWKGHGLDLERTRLGHFLRPTRLTFAVPLWYLWLVTRGSQMIKAGQRRLVDHRNRRDLLLPHRPLHDGPTLCFGFALRDPLDPVLLKL